jgi:hypothetical protein
MASKRSFTPPPKGGKFNPKPNRDKDSGRVTPNQPSRHLGSDREARRLAVTNWQEKASSADKKPERTYGFVTGVTITARSLKGSQIINPEKAFYPKEIFDNQAEYDASVDSVVARIKSGTVKARTPDE